MATLAGLTAGSGVSGRFVADELGRISLAPDGREGRADILRDETVLVFTRTQRAAVLALLEADGLARRLVLCTPDLPPAPLREAATLAGATLILTDAADDAALAGIDLPRVGVREGVPAPAMASVASEWALFTSGTSGAPKLAVHTLATLTAAIDRRRPAPGRAWATFYDIRRYGGLQILLRALIGGGSMVLSGADDVTAHLGRLAAAGVTFLSGTPTHWRRALLSPAASLLPLADVRLSGEIADQPILDKLRAAWPGGRVCHAFASTEAGVAFEVSDGMAGFPAALLDRDGAVQLRVVDGTLRIRSPGQAQRYLGANAALADREGFVDTRDLVVANGERLFFAGRSDGVINVGGLKVHPAEVESVVAAHPRVAFCRVGARRSPIIGQVIVADVVLRDPMASADGLDRELIEVCRRQLASHKVPAMIRLVPDIDVNAAGKIVRIPA